MIGDSIATAAIQRALDGVWRREKTVGANIANHDTPGYKAVKVEFEDELKKVIRKFSVKSASKTEFLNNLEIIKNSPITAVKDQTYIERADSSNVNLEYENIEMAKAQLQYSYLSREITDHFTRLRYAIREGR